LVKKHFKDVLVYDFKKGRGKTAMLNKILSENTSDVIILMDADTILNSNYVFEEMINMFKKEKDVGIVCAYHQFLANDTLIGKLAHFGFRVWDKARWSLRERGIRYFCEGGLIAFSRNFAKKIRYPETYHVGDDSFAFYFAVENRFKVLLADKAIAYYELPKNYKDYARQMKRFLCDPSMVKDVFGNSLTTKYETLTKSALLKIFLSEFVKNPFLGFGYTALQLSVRLQMPFFRQNVGWYHIERS